MTVDLFRQSVRRAGLEIERLRLRRRIGRTPRSLDPGRVVGELPEVPDVLFLCHGNVCRSPLAERYARQRVADGRARFDSAGFLQREGRSSPDVAVAAAEEHGVDLSAHRSTPVTSTQLSGSDLVVVMDVRNYRSLRRDFPEHVDEAWFLRAFVPGDGVEIADPYGDDRAAFETVYGQVVDGVDGLLATLAAARSTRASP